MKRPTAITTQLDLPIRVADLSFFVLFSGAIRQGLVSDLGATCFTVLVVLKSHARTSDGRVYLSVSQLASLTGLAPNTVRAALKKLEQKQLVQVVEEGKTATRRYFIIDQFAWKKLDGSVTDALEALEDGLSDGRSSVRYVPRSSTLDRQQLQAWLEANQVPTSPNVAVVHQEVQRQVVQQQVVQQQVVQQQVVQHIHIHPPGTGEASAEAAVEYTAPFLRESRVLKARELVQPATEPSATAGEGLRKP
jgi:DNA-binding transcriptional ArsR family regulator